MNDPFGFRVIINGHRVQFRQFDTLLATASCMDSESAAELKRRIEGWTDLELFCRAVCNMSAVPFMDGICPKIAFCKDRVVEFAIETDPRGLPLLTPELRAALEATIKGT